MIILESDFRCDICGDDEYVTITTSRREILSNGNYGTATYNRRECLQRYKIALKHIFTGDPEETFTREELQARVERDHKELRERNNEDTKSGPRRTHL